MSCHLNVSKDGAFSHGQNDFHVVDRTIDNEQSQELLKDCTKYQTTTDKPTSWYKEKGMKYLISKLINS